MQHVTEDINEVLRAHVVRHGNLSELSRSSEVSLSSLRRFRSSGYVSLRNAQRLMRVFAYAVVGERWAEQD